MANHKRWTLILKLRSNIELEGDLQLAEMEISRLLDCLPEPLDRSELDSLVSEGVLLSHDARHCRKNGIVAYRASTNEFEPFKLFQRLSFVELVVGEANISEGYSDKALQALERVPAPFIRLESCYRTLRFRLIPFNTAAEWSDVVAKRATSPEEAIKALERTLKLALEGDCTHRRESLPEQAISARLTTGHLFHGLHIYKAKFFPRMARAILNIWAPCTNAVVLDPYVGSGTALTEATVMGMPSAGVDIDPLSVLIAQAKVNLLHAAEGTIREQALTAIERLESLKSGQPSLFQIHDKRAAYGVIPPFLLRRIPAPIQEEIAGDIALSLSAITGLDEAIIPLRVALSDAISRKLRFRFLGLGYGRFSLTIAPWRIAEMFRSNLEYLAKSIAVWCWLREVARIPLPPSEALLGDARALPFENNTFDLVITSPPYMPASSGRENYLKSKALAMTVLGLLRSEQIEEQEARQVGSVHRAGTLEELPPRAREVVQWMESDEVRRVKAAATAGYFADLAQSLREIRRVLRPGGAVPSSLLASTPSIATARARLCG